MSRRYLRFLPLGLLFLFSCPVLRAADDKNQPETQAAPAIDHWVHPLPKGAIARLGTLRLRHSTAMGFSAVFAPDGRSFASTGFQDGIHLWNADTGKEIGRLENPEASMYLLGYSPSARLLAASEWKDGSQVVLWNMVTSKVRQRLRAGKGMVLAAEFLDGGKTLVTVGWEGVVRWWDIATGKGTREWAPFGKRLDVEGFRNRDGLVQASFSRDGRILVAGRERATENEGKRESLLLAWNLMERKELCRFTEKEALPYQFSLSADGKWLAALVGRLRTGATLWDLANRTAAFQVPRGQNNSFQAVALDGTGANLAVAGDGDVRIWNTATKRSVSTGIFGSDFGSCGSQSMEASGSYCPRALFFSRDGAKLFIRSGDSMALWDVQRQTEFPHLDGHRRAATWLNFSADGRTLFSGEGGQWRFSEEVIAWDTATWKALHHTRGEVDGFCPWSPDHSVRVVQKDEDGSLFVQETRTGKNLCELELRYKNVYMSGGFFSSDNELVAMPLPRMPRPWPLLFMDARTGTRLGLIRNPPVGSERLFLSADHKAAAWYNGDGTLQVHDVTTNKQICKLGEARQRGDLGDPAVAFSSRKQYVASWDRSSPDIVVWDLARARQLRRIPHLEPYFTRFYNVAFAFSPDERLLAVGALGGQKNTVNDSVQIWELSSGKIRREFRGHVKTAVALAFSPDGRQLASGSADTTVLIWDLYGLESPLKAKWTQANLEELWENLADVDARRAGNAVAALIHSPGQAEPFLEKHLERPRPADPKRVAVLLSDLESPAFAVRNKASRALAELGDLAEPALRQIASKNISLEFRRRVERLLQDIEDTSTPSRLREARAVEILEFLGTRAARKVLESLAAGATEARLTRDAQRTLLRLGQHTRVKAPR